MSEAQTVGAAVAEVQAAPRMLDESRWADVLPAHIGPAKFQRWALTRGDHWPPRRVPWSAETTGR